VAGPVDREVPLVGRAGVAQPAEFEGGAVGQDAVEVAEGGVVADRDAGQFGPAPACSGTEPLLQDVLVGSGYFTTASIFTPIFTRYEWCRRVVPPIRSRMRHKDPHVDVQSVRDCPDRR
jgi:hypothetical protein